MRYFSVLREFRRNPAQLAVECIPVDVFQPKEGALMLRNWGLIIAVMATLSLAACGNATDTPALNKPIQTASAVDPNGNNGIQGDVLGRDDGTAFPVDVGNTVLFETDAVDLAPDAQNTLQRQAQWMQQHPAALAIVEGHADERGTREYNLGLGERRAESVRAYLIALGVDAARLQTISYGKEQPLCAEATEACWRGNRRGVTALNR
jgi:peptidoglycan-associated lipoprotein